MADVVQVRQARPFAAAAAVIGLLLMVAQVPFFIAAGLVAPLWAVFLLIAAWILLFTLGVFWFREHPVRVLLVPLFGAAVWMAAIAVGESLLGWVA